MIIQNKRNLQTGSTLIIIAVLVVIALGLMAVVSRKSMTSSVMPTLPPVESRLNSDPLSNYSIDVQEVTPGSQVTVSEVRLAASAKVSVYKEVSGKKVVIGSSAVLPAGISNDVSIHLTSALKNGDVIDFLLDSGNGQFVKGEDGTEIRVQKPVGTLMTHYENEY